MVNVRFALISLVILVGCGKKVDNSSLSNSKQKLTDTRGGNSIMSVVTPPDPPVIIPADLTAANPGGTDVVVATASEYNSLDPQDQIYYTGLKNAIQYLFQVPAPLSTTLQFNADGSYSITVNGDDEPPAGDSCTVCGVKSAYKCKEQIAKYMKDNNLNSITATIKNVQVGDDKCVKIVYKYYPPNEPVIDNGGTLVETYAPSVSNPPTFTDQQFNDFIQTATLWYGSAHPPAPLVWGQADINVAVDAFVIEALSPSYAVYQYASQPGFISSLKSYIATHY